MPKKYLRSAICAVVLGLVAVPASASEDIVIPHRTPHGGKPLGDVVCFGTTRQDNESAVRATNATRKARGLKPLRASSDLALAAARHACDMARRSVISHRGTNSRGPMQRVKKTGYKPGIAAENIAAGPWGQEQVLTEWVRSKGHLDNILIPQIRDYGIGKAIGADGRTVFWAAVYSAPKRR
jgi:uncharacterized protein YkwD